MQIVVIEHYTDRRREFAGDPGEVLGSLFATYNWLRHHRRQVETAEDAVAELNRCQAFSAWQPNGDILIKAAPTPHTVAAMVGFDLVSEAIFAAARFLAGSPDEVAPEAKRRQLHAADGDIEKAALLVYGLSDTPEMLEALRAVRDTSDLQKAAEDYLKSPEEVSAVTDSGAKFRDIVRRAITATNGIREVDLPGKHTAGTLLAQDPQTHEVILLKPGSGPQSPTSGARQSVSSQSKREAAFWAASDIFGVSDKIPEAHVILIDNQEYAAIKMLPIGFKTALETRRADPNAVSRALQVYRPEGNLHRWAVMDYVLGNPDRHAQNVMLRGSEVMLIDHGSALAGTNFAPGTDDYSFVPFYLRGLGPNDWYQLDRHDKVRMLPRVHISVAMDIKDWLYSLDTDGLKSCLDRYGIDTGPCLLRLDRLRKLASEVPPDLAINQVWVMS